MAINGHITSRQSQKFSLSSLKDYIQYNTYRLGAESWNFAANCCCYPLPTLATFNHHYESRSINYNVNSAEKQCIKSVLNIIFSEISCVHNIAVYHFQIIISWCQLRQIHAIHGVHEVNDRQHVITAPSKPGSLELVIFHFVKLIEFSNNILSTSTNI